MLSRDQLKKGSVFHPILLALKDKERIKEIQLDEPYLRDKQPIWLMDYPILCYIRKKKSEEVPRNIVVVNLADCQLP